MAGRMAQRAPAPLPAYARGAASDTGNILNQRAPGTPIPAPRPSPPPPRRAPVQTRHTENRQAAMATRGITGPPPVVPPPPPDPIRLPQDSGVWRDTANLKSQVGGPSGITGVERAPETGPDTPSLLGPREMPFGAIADTANILQGTEQDPDREQSRWDLVPKDSPEANQAQERIWAGMGPDERADYVQLKAVMDRGILNEGTPVQKDVERSLHNVVVQAQYRGLAQWAWEKQQLSGDGPTGAEFGGFFDANVLGGGQENLYTPNVVLWYDAASGMYSIVSKAQATQQMVVDARNNPGMAGRLITAMLRAEVIPGAQRQYAAQYLRTDADGNPVGMWPTEYDEHVSTMIDRIAAQQFQAKAPDQHVRGAWEEINAQGDRYAAVMDDPALSDEGYGMDSGGGGGGGFGGGFGGFGGGGGGGTPGSVFLTDPTALGAQIDSIARARLGRTLTDAEKAAFVAHFHSLETAYSNAYNARAGGTLTQPEMEGQAVAWIENNFMGEQRQETSGEFVSALAAFIRGPGLGSGGN